jgi:integrase
VAGITIQEQERFVRHLRERGLAKGPIKRTIGVLGAAMRRAYNTNQLAAVPAVLKPTYFGPDAERQRLLSMDEVKAMWDAEMPEYIRVFLALANNTAARPEAILELRGNQDDLERRLLHLNPCGRIQTKKYRPTLPISNTLLPYLDANRVYQVQWKKNQKRPLGSPKKAWASLREQAGLDRDVVPYTIRHTMATELRRRGVPEWECRGFMGHRSGGVTERYAKFQPDHLSAAVKAIDAYCVELDAICEKPVLFTRQVRELRASYAPGEIRVDRKSLKIGAGNEARLVM